MSSLSTTSRALIVDCNGIIKRYSYFFNSNNYKKDYYSFDRFCNVLIGSIIRFKPSVIYTTVSSPTDNAWRKELYPQYKSHFSSGIAYDHYKQNLRLLDELPQYFPIINHVTCPLLKNESGDLSASLIHQNTSNYDEIFVLSQQSKFEQLLSRNDDKSNKITLVKTIKKNPDDTDDELNFSFSESKNNSFGLESNKLIIDYLSLVGVHGDNICGVKGIGPVRAIKLLKHGNIPYLLTNSEWKEKNVKIAKLIEENESLLKLFYEKLIPFDNNAKIDENILNNIIKLDDDYYQQNDTTSLLQLMYKFAEKYQLGTILYRLKAHSKLN